MLSNSPFSDVSLLLRWVSHPESRYLIPATLQMEKDGRSRMKKGSWVSSIWRTFFIHRLSRRFLLCLYHEHNSLKTLQFVSLCDVLLFCSFFDNNDFGEMKTNWREWPLFCSQNLVIDSTYCRLFFLSHTFQGVVSTQWKLCFFCRHKCFCERTRWVCSTVGLTLLLMRFFVFAESGFLLT